MIELVLKGIVTGFILSIMIGPVFFVLLETSIRKGIRAALAFDLGVLISDIVYILIAYIFYKEVEDLSSGSDNHVIRLIGGVLFTIYGVYNFFKKVKSMNVDGKLRDVANAKDYILLGLKGFILNIANPLVIFYWFSVMALGASHSKSESSSWTIFLFLVCILVTFFAVDILKIVGAKRLRPLVTTSLLVALNRLIGIVFLGFGVFLIIQGIIGMMGWVK